MSVNTVLHQYLWCCFRRAPQEQDFNNTTTSAVGDITDVDAAYTAITNDQVDSVNNFTKTKVRDESEISSTSWEGTANSSNVWQESDFARMDFITPEPVYPNADYWKMKRTVPQEIKASGA